MTHEATSSSPVIWTANDLAENPHEAADKADRVQRMFAAIARNYDLNNRLHSLGRDQAWRRKAVRLSVVQSTDAVLDVACGTGDLTLAYAAAGPQRVVGVDFTEQMLDIARHKMQQRAAGSVPVDFQWADAMDLPFADASFDVVSIAFGLRNVAEPMRALREFRRVLRPGGRVLILEFSEPRNPIVRWGNALYCRHIMPMTATLIARDRSGAYRYLPKSVQTFSTTAQLADDMRDAGFASIEQFPMTMGVCTATRAVVADSR